MRNVVLYIAMSLDGYIADEAGGVDWLTEDGSAPEAPGSYPDFYESIDTVVMGWNTYHQVVTQLSPDQWVYQGKECYVITHQRRESREGIHFFDGDVTTLLDQLQKRPGKGIWICGGAAIAQPLIQADRVDRYHLSVIPTLLGRGLRLLPELERERPLKLCKTMQYNGIVDLVYERR